MNLSLGAAILVLLMVVHTNGDRNKFYTMPSTSTCGKTKDIDGAVIRSSSGSYSSSLYSQCYFTLEVDDYHAFSRKSFMLRFETWRVTDCSVKLTIFDGRQTQVPAKTLTCRDKNPEIIYLKGRYAKLSLSHNQGSTGFNFKIVATVVDSSSYCSEFRCDNRHCIEKDLRCDGVDHCFDRSDETTSYCKARFDVSRVFNIGVGLIVGIVVIIVIVCLVIVVIAVCCCRRRRAGFVRGPPTTTITTTPAPVVAPPPGSYPTQPAYPMQQPPPPQQPGVQPAAYYPYGQGQGFAQPPPVQASYQQMPPAYQEASAPPLPMK